MVHSVYDFTGIDDCMVSTMSYTGCGRASACYGKTIGREGVLVGVKHIIWIKKKDPKEGCFGGGGN